jgi:uncharacterized membrane protein YfcA
MEAIAVAAACAVIAGAALQSALGFGFALVAAPLTYAAFGPEQGVGLLLALGLEVNLLTLVAERRRPTPVWADVAWVVPCSLPGALLGVVVLRGLDDLALQLLVSVAVLGTLVVNLRAAHRRDGPRREPPAWGRPLSGVASGALNTSTATGGPPLVLLLMGRGLEPATVRDTLTAAFVGFAFTSTIALIVTGTAEAAPDAGRLAILIPLTAVGQMLGRPLFRRLVGAASYERVLTVVLALSIVLGMISVL